jgi:hypothetical protein
MIFGNPIVEGSFDFEITATDSNGCSGVQSYTLSIIAAPVCLFCDDFTDGVVATNWTYKNFSSWSENNGNLVGSSSQEITAIAKPAFVGCRNCYVEATLQTAGGSGNNILRLLHHYIDKNNFVELMMKEHQDRWILRQHRNKKVVEKEKTNLPINPNVPYVARITFDGMNYIVSIDGVEILTLTPTGTVVGGTVGFEVKDTTGSFGYIEVN